MLSFSPCHSGGEQIFPIFMKHLCVILHFIRLGRKKEKHSLQWTKNRKLPQLDLKLQKKRRSLLLHHRKEVKNLCCILGRPKFLEYKRVLWKIQALKLNPYLRKRRYFLWLKNYTQILPQKRKLFFISSLLFKRKPRSRVHHFFEEIAENECEYKLKDGHVNEVVKTGWENLKHFMEHLKIHRSFTLGNIEVLTANGFEDMAKRITESYSKLLVEKECSISSRNTTTSCVHPDSNWQNITWMFSIFRSWFGNWDSCFHILVAIAKDGRKSDFLEWFPCITNHGINDNLEIIRNTISVVSIPGSTKILHV